MLEQVLKLSWDKYTHCNYFGVREVYEMMVDMKGFVEYEDK